MFSHDYNQGMYKRHITNSIIEALSDTPVILISGARQTGKSTLCEIIMREGRFQWQFVTDDSALCAAVKVDYTFSMPVTANLEDYVKHVTGQKKIDFSNLYLSFLCTKSIGWQYQKEWRCIINKSEYDDNLFEHVTVSPQEIEAIYLGCKIEESNQEKILNCLENSLDHVKVFQARKDKRNYKLNFEAINSN